MDVINTEIIKSKRSSIAIAVITMGIISLFPFLSFYFAIPNLFLGIFELFRIKHSNKNTGGKKLIWIGIIFTVTGLFLSLFLTNLLDSLHD